MNMFRQLTIWFLCLISIIPVEGRSADENEFKILNRSKRSTSFPCSTTTSLKKYQYVSGHTACISPSPDADLTTAGVTTAEQTEIVTEHNNYRRATDATDMVMMSWDTEIAYIAQKWAENCQKSHDYGYKRRIPGRLTTGQNLAWSTGKMGWTNAIKLWHDEISNFVYDTDVTAVTGHYTQVVWAKSIKIGCGYAKCGGTSNIHLYACNYGPAGNLNIKKPYTPGTKCGDCAGHCENNLCNCNMVCLNGGTLNLGTCTCSCITGYSGDDCSLDCSVKKTDPNYCLNSYTVNKCSQYSNVPDECPNMCSFCPIAGTALTGTSDGMGVIPFVLTAGGGGGGGSCCHGYNIRLLHASIIISCILYRFR